MSNKPELAAAIAKNALRRDQDRAAFGLPPRQDKAQAPATVPHVEVPLLTGDKNDPSLSSQLPIGPGS
ncbi:hypothetical protein QTH87_25760 [Variovorax sp. J22P168]|uniref:hypothetical protein n=1 Tax=Variovorax jilinensis TaxID=3053513 RepID=UPI00257584BE|nr:hypothetical protein [Variovorax sp. J22P168]MDM0015872.1 hypothetical protein [Variovorax sp. J22P168]